MRLSIDDIKARLDAYQRRTPWLAFPIAVAKKAGDDKGGQLAALITYYSFFSLFPLLLVAFTILGFVLSGNPQLQADIAGTLQEKLPIPGVSAETLNGSGLALIVGIVLSLWSGLGATQVAQDAMNTIWDVPRHVQPNFVAKRLQGLLLLLVLGGGLIASAAASQLAQLVGDGTRVATAFATFGVNAALFCVMVRVLAGVKISLGELKWAAIAAGIGWTALQFVGGWYTNRLIGNADKTYGTFAVVIGLLSWILLQVKVLIYAAELASVGSRRLWPRSLDPNNPTEADNRVAEAIIARNNPLSVDATDNENGSDGVDKPSGTNGTDNSAHEVQANKSSTP